MGVLHLYLLITKPLNKKLACVQPSRSPKKIGEGGGCTQANKK